MKKLKEALREAKAVNMGSAPTDSDIGKVFIVFYPEDEEHIGSNFQIKNWTIGQLLDVTVGIILGKRRIPDEIAGVYKSKSTAEKVAKKAAEDWLRNKNK